MFLSFIFLIIILVFGLVLFWFLEFVSGFLDDYFYVFVLNNNFKTF